MMLVHIGQAEIAGRVHNAWLAALGADATTADVTPPGRTPLGTRAFADAVVARLGERPATLPAVTYAALPPFTSPAPAVRQPEPKTMDGVDVFVHRAGTSPDALATTLREVSHHCPFQLQMISNRGVTVWPGGLPETFRTDHWRTRFLAPAGGSAPFRDVLDLLDVLERAGVDVVKTEGLYRFSGQPGYSLSQGQ